MMIMVAGPYTAGTEEQREINLDRLNQAAALVLATGHIPIIGVNAALPVAVQPGVSDPRKTIMDISLALAERCDAILMVAESPGANREREVIERKGRPVYYRIEDVPAA